MASAEQLKALLRAYMEGDQGRFLSIADQVAAHESRLGHSKLASELQQLVQDVRDSGQKVSPPRAIPISQPKGELADLLTASYPKHRLSEMVLPPRIRQRLFRVVQEQRHGARIRSHGLSPRRKLLFVGPPGTGKTLSATVLAGELALPLFVVRLDRMITKFMGETAAKLRLIFDNIAQVRAVYLFDEFDTIGAQRGLRNEVGEIRRVLNSFLQFIETDHSQSLILAATNHPDILDHALFRRFDDVIQYDLPTIELVIEILQNKLASVRKDWRNWNRLGKLALGMSHADIARAAEDSIKQMLIADREILSEKDVMQALDERKIIGRT